jgi:branched-chain amino acid transport system substrate-binding protein
MKQLDWKPKAVINYCSGYQDPKIAEQLGRDGWEFMGSAGYTPEFGRKYMKAVAAVEKYYKKKIGVPFDSNSIQEAVALYVLALAIEKAGSLDTQKIADILHSVTFDSPLSMGGEVAFDAGGQNVKARSVISQLLNGTYVTISPEKYREREPVFPMAAWGK